MCFGERVGKDFARGDLIINMGLGIFQIRGGWQERGEEEIEGGGGWPSKELCDLFSTFSGGFFKFSLSHPYQQFLLAPEARELLTLNTHKGLVQSIGLQFAFHSPSGIFYCEIESRLSKVPLVIVRANDISF